MKRANILFAFIAFLMMWAFTPTITITEQEQIVINLVDQAYAEDAGQSGNGNNGNNSNSNSGSNSGDGKREDDDDDQSGSDDGDDDTDVDDADSGKDDDTSGKDEPTKKSKSKDKNEPDPAKFVSREQYETLEQRLNNLESQQSAARVNERVEYAKAQKFVDGDDEETINELKEIAKNDAAWNSFIKVAKPIVPSHIAARKFQKESLRSGKTNSEDPFVKHITERQKR